MGLIRESGEGRIERPDAIALRTEAWRETRARAARLLPSTLLLTLDGYYSRLEALLALQDLSLSGKKMHGRWLLAIIKDEMSDEIEWATNPSGWYLARTLEAEDEALSSIIGYLNSTNRPRMWV